MSTPEFSETPSPENPIVVVGDEIRVNIENLYAPSRGINPIFEADPVVVLNFSDFRIDPDGNFYVNYNTGPLVYGRINEDDDFVPSENLELTVSKYGVSLHDTRPGRGHMNFGINVVEIKPGDIIKFPGTNEGVFKTPGLPLEQYRGKNLTPVFFDRLHPYTMDQVREHMTYARHNDFSITHNAALRKTLYAGLYVIYHKSSNKMYSKYEFVKAVFTDRKKKTQGYLVFKKSEPIRKRELQELAPIVEELKYRPIDNPASMFGTEYRAAKQSFDEASGQAFTEGEKFKEVIGEIRKSDRESRSATQEPDDVGGKEDSEEDNQR